MKLSEYAFPNRYGKPYAHQVETVRFLLQNPRAFIFSGLGSGKSLSVLWTCDVLRLNKKISKVLILCPKSTVYSVWIQSVWEHIPTRTALPLIGTKAKRLENLQKDALFYVCNVDGAKVIEKELIQKKFDIVVIDEATSIGNYTSKRSKAVYNICKDVKGVYSMTATPVANTPLTAFGLARVTNPMNPALPRSFFKYRDLVCRLDYNGFDWVPKEGHEKVVSAVLSPSIRFETRDCIDLPPTIYIDRDIELSDEVMTAYKKIKKDMTHEFSEGRVTAVNAASKLTKLLQVSAGGVIAEDGRVVPLCCRQKIDEIVALYNENGQQPVVISAIYSNSIDYIVNELLMRNYKVDYINGSRTTGARGMTIKNFQDGKLDFIVLQIASSAHGITLTRSNLLINFTPTMSAELSEQLHARIIRSGQTKTTIIANLISTPTEKRFYKALQDKQVMSDIIMAEFTA